MVFEKIVQPDSADDVTRVVYSRRPAAEAARVNNSRHTCCCIYFSKTISLSVRLCDGHTKFRPALSGMGAPLSRGAARRINALWFPTHLLTTDRSAFILRQSYRKTRGEPMARKKKTDMLQGMLDLLILRSLRGGPLNGWDIMQRIQIVSGDVFRVIPGSLYPALHRLEAG